MSTTTDLTGKKYGPYVVQIRPLSAAYAGNPTEGGEKIAHLVAQDIADARASAALAVFTATGCVHSAETADVKPAGLTIEKLIHCREKLKEHKNNCPVGMFVSEEVYHAVERETEPGSPVEILSGIPLEIDPLLKGTHVIVCSDRDEWNKHRFKIRLAYFKDQRRASAEFDLSAQEAQRFNEYFDDVASRYYASAGDAYNSGNAFPARVERNLAKLRRRSAKAAAYQARRYVAKTVRRMRRKERAQ